MDAKPEPLKWAEVREHYFISTHPSRTAVRYRCAHCGTDQFIRIDQNRIEPLSAHLTDQHADKLAGREQ